MYNALLCSACQAGGGEKIWPGILWARRKDAAILIGHTRAGTAVDLSFGKNTRPFLGNKNT